MTTFADRLAALLQHRRIDPLSDLILDALLGALGDPFETAALIAYGDPDQGIEPKRALDDPAVAPLQLLAHAALYTGGVMPARMPGETDDAYTARARDAVVFPAGIRRGTYAAVKLAAAPYLTGTKLVDILPPQDATPYDLPIRVRESECADPDALAAALQGDFVSGGRPGVINAEMRLVLVVSDEPLIDEISRDIDGLAEPINDMTTAGTT